MVDFVQPGDLHEHDPAISRKVSRISFRPRGPVSDRNFEDIPAMYLLRLIKLFLFLILPAQMQLLSHPLTPEELLDFTLNPIAVYAEYSVS